jgi:thiamine-phosphate pyrophosphorylase
MSTGASRNLGIEAAFRTRLGRRPPIVYAIVDVRQDDLAQAEALAVLLFSFGADCVQLRAKELAPRRFEALVRALHPRAEAAGVPLIVNDRVDVALAAGARGVHLGQDDMPPAEARALLGSEAILGYSTHSLDEIRAAQGLPVDYLGFGAMFSTKTRLASRVTGPQALTLAGASSTLPLIAIGGIVPERLRDLPLASVAGVAAAAAFTPLEHTVDVLQRFRDTLRGA